MKIITLFALALLIGVSKGFCEANTHSSLTAGLLNGARILISDKKKTASDEILANYYMGYLEGVIESLKDEIKIPATTPTNVIVQNLALELVQTYKKAPESFMKLDRNMAARICLTNLYPKEDPSSANSVSVPTNGNEFPITFSDKHGIFEIQILEILKGQEIVDRKKCEPHNLSKAKDQGKKCVYFFIKITNKKLKESKSIYYFNFDLESVEGEITAGNMSNDALAQAISAGRSARGGLLFEYYDDQTPKTLIWPLGLIDVKKYGYLTIDEEEIFAKSPDLSKFFK